MNISDILEIIVACGLILLPLSYYFHESIKNGLRALRYFILPPRYLKKVTVLRNTVSNGVKTNHE